VPTTPTYGFRYPALTDPPNVPQDIRNLAEDVEAKLLLVDAATAAITGLAASQDAQPTIGSTSSTAYTATLAGGTACGLSFIAPPSGQVYVSNNMAAFNGIAGGYALCTIRVRTGGVVGSGADVFAASDDEAVYTSFDDLSASRRTLVTGLTPGSTYNAQQLFRVLSNTANYQRKKLIVEPSV
jgi:hypothetical protein